MTWPEVANYLRNTWRWAAGYDKSTMSTISIRTQLSMTIRYLSVGYYNLPECILEHSSRR